MSHLSESARKWVLTCLPYDKTDAALDTYLQNQDARQLLIVYHNWMSRLIKPERRTIHRSRAFEENPLHASLQESLTQIEQDIEYGHDLRKYLSRGVDVAAAVPGARLGRRRDLDLMLTTQQVHHLHVSTEMEPDGYVKRCDHLLFAVFKPKNAYLIDIMSHGDWTRDHVLDVMSSEWPSAGLTSHIPNAIGLRHNYTETERGILQKKRR